MEIHVSLAAETLFTIGPVNVTNSMVTMFLVMGLILLVFGLLSRRAEAVPGRGQGVIEMIFEFLLNLVEATAGRRLGRRIFPLISGLFIFIIFANFSGILPGVGTIVKEPAETHEEAEVSGDVEVPEADATAVAQVADAVTGDDDEADIAAATTTDDHGDDGHYASAIPILRPPSADLNMTLALSLLTFTVVQIAGVSAHGVGGRLKHMADPPFLFPIELISELSRIVSLSARLFGNVFAGEVLLAVMYALSAAIKVAIIPVLFPVAFIGMEVLFGTIQALVFALLTLIYITLAAAGHDDHGHEEAHDHRPADVSHAPARTATAGD